MKWTGWTVAAAVAGVGFVFPAAAQQSGSSGTFPSFDAVDANLDGAITPAEFERELSEVENPDQLFAEADADQNGQIGRPEWSDWRQQRMAGVAAERAPEPAAGAELPRRIEVSLTDETLDGKYITDAGLVGLDGNTISFGLLFSDERDIVGSSELLAPGLIDQWLPAFLSLSLGGKAYLGMLDDPDDDLFALAIGAEARADLPLEIPMAAVGRVFYAPDIVTFGDSDTVLEIDGRFEVRFLPGTTGFVGYRLLNFEREGSGEEKIVNGLHAGLRFAF
jgi:YfaZ precursor/EF hand